MQSIELICIIITLYYKTDTVEWSITFEISLLNIDLVFIIRNCHCIAQIYELLLGYGTLIASIYLSRIEQYNLDIKHWCFYHNKVYCY